MQAVFLTALGVPSKISERSFLLLQYRERAVFGIAFTSLASWPRIQSFSLEPSSNVPENGSENPEIVV